MLSYKSILTKFMLVTNWKKNDNLYRTLIYRNSILKKKYMIKYRSQKLVHEPTLKFSNGST